MLLSTAMVLTDAGMSVSAAESTAAAETIEENLIKDTEKETEKETKEGTDQEKSTASAESAAESKVEETTKETESQASAESVSSETESAEERTTQGTASEPEESTIEERTEEKTSVEESKTENASSAETVTETAVVEETRTEETSSVETVTETAEVEETQTEETTAEETTEETLTGETETETEVQESETQEVLAEDVIAQGTYENITWIIDLDGKLTVTGTGDFAPASNWGTRAPWSQFNNAIKSASVDVKGMTDARYMFDGCWNMTEIDLSHFDTSQIVFMDRMFGYCENLKNLDLSSFNTSNVEHMTQMFMECKNLESLDLSSFDTSKVINMGEMFIGCSNLTYVDMSSFDVSSACQKIDTYDGSGMQDMFISCIALSEIKAPRNVPETESPSLPRGTLWNGSDGSKYTELPKKSESITLTRAELEGVIAQGQYKEEDNDITWVIDNDGKLTVSGTGNFASAVSYQQRSRAPWYDFRNSIISAEIHVQGMTDARYMFYDCNKMIEADVSELDTHSITTMEGMFYQCESLTNLDVSGFDTSNVRSMMDMFYHCHCLKNLDVSGFNTSNVEDMRAMFLGCSSLTNLDVSGFDTSKVGNMELMFSGCNGLTNLDLSNFNTGMVGSMEGMFHGCSGLVSLDVTSFSTGHVGYMRDMFSDCNNLESLNLSGFETGAMDMSYMFGGCLKLKSLDLRGFYFGNIESEKNVETMISGCESLTQINTPYNLSLSIALPQKGVWQDPEGNVYTELPKGKESIVLTKEAEIVKQGTYQEDGNDITWTINANGKLRVTGVGDFAPAGNGSYVDTYRAPWFDDRETIKTAEITVTGMTDAGGMFWDCGNLTAVDLSNFDTSQLVSTSYMFSGCENLESIDFNHFNTENLERIDRMFERCTKLTSIDLSSFDTRDVTNMNGVFSGCKNLTTVDLSSFDTSSVTDMSYMFYGCSRLTSIDLSSFNVESVGVESDGYYETGMDEMFEACIALKEIHTPKNVPEEENVLLPGRAVWYDANNNQYTQLPKETDSIVLKKAEIEGVLVQDTFGDIEWKIDTNGKLTVTGTGNVTDYESTDAPQWYEYRDVITTAELNVKGMTNASNIFMFCENLTSIDLSNLDTSNITNMRSMFSGCKNLNNLDLSSFDTSKVTDMSYMFSGCKNLDSLDLSSFDTSNVTDMFYMFSGCENLDSLDLSSFDTSKVRAMQGMFSECESLKRLDLSFFDTSNVTSMSFMFNYCSSLESLNVSSFDTKKVTSMYSMFSGCNNLTSLNLSNFDTGNVTDMGWMFGSCMNLTSLNLSNFNTGNVTNMTEMFFRCDSLESLNISSFDTSNVKSMQLMFYHCNLVDLDISNFNTSNVTNMIEMFSGCNNLTSLNISNFDTGNVTNMRGMFLFCENLTNLDIGSLDTSKVTDMRYIFAHCSNLTSLDLSNFDLSSVMDIDDIFDGDSRLTQLYTPQNVLAAVALPSYGTWYDIKGNEYIELPQDRSDSILLARDERPSECITVTKKKTSYHQWDKIDTSDLTVKYHDSEGDVVILSASEYTTNADKIDTSILGPQTLTVTYKDFTAEISLTITERIRTTVNLTGIDTKDYTYSKKPVSPTVLAMTADGTDVTSAIKDILVCTYTGTQADGTEYATTNEAPTNAGEYTLTAVIPEDSLDYIGGSQTFDFTIRKAQVTITASDISLTTGAALPKPEDYKYTLSSPATEEDLEKKPTLTCSITDTSKEGTYDIVIADAALKVNPNYEAEIKYINGKVEVTAYYTVTFDLSGKGESTTQENIKKGSTISQPADPQAEGFTFTGWYKDKECTTKWDFASDKIESDTTLYAGWKAKEDDDNKDDDDKDDDKDDSSEDKDDSAYTSQERVTLSSVSAEIAAIKSRVYDGTAYRPGVRVTAIADGRKVTLTEGTDYRVLYKNNINAGQATVTVKGNGIYKGECSKNFTITAKPINKLKIITGGVTLGSSIQNLPVYVYDGAVLLKSGTDYTLSGYSAGTSTASVTVTGKANYTGTATAKLTVYSVSSDKIINPENVTLNVQSVPYTGKSIKNVEPTVRIGGTTLVKNKDYKVQYQNNKNAGTAFVIVTGKGAYKGKAVVPFTIKAVNAGSMNIKPLSVKTYNGKLQKPAVTVTVNGKKLSKDKDYTVTYKNNLHAGTATVIVTGKGNYAGMKGEAKFTINPQKISKASVKGTQGNLTLTYSKRTLKEGADYEKPIYGSASKNKIKVTIKGKKDFTGEVTKSVKIH